MDHPPSSRRDRDCRFIETVRCRAASVTNTRDVESLRDAAFGLAQAVEGDMHPDLRRQLPTLADRLEFIAAGVEGPEVPAARRALSDFLLAVEGVCPPTGDR